jgi:hypothetical protein
MPRVARLARENRDAVVRLLSKELALIPAFLKKQGGELVVSTLCFLHAKNIRFDRVDPTDDVRHSCED